jgi:hypothetical protein
MMGRLIKAKPGLTGDDATVSSSVNVSLASSPGFAWHSVRHWADESAVSQGRWHFGSVQRQS